MATIYTITMTTSFFSKDFKKTHSHTSVVGAYQNERDAKDFLTSRVHAYEWRYTDIELQ